MGRAEPWGKPTEGVGSFIRGRSRTRTQLQRSSEEKISYRAQISTYMVSRGRKHGVRMENAEDEQVQENLGEVCFPSRQQAFSFCLTRLGDCKPFPGTVAVITHVYKYICLCNHSAEPPTDTFQTLAYRFSNLSSRIFLVWGWSDSTMGRSLLYL